MFDPSTLSREAKIELVAVLEEQDRRNRRRKFFGYYPETGQLSRHNYDAHMRFFAASAEHEEVAFIAGNRTGKSHAGAYAATCHLTGRYPPWWPGRRFNRPTVGWGSGVDAKTVRETLQATLFGPPADIGTGMIPGDYITRTSPRSGVPDAIDNAMIKHVSGGISRLLMKSYDQGRESFQGAKIDFGLCDEEPPLPVYTELLIRTMATVPGEENGLVMSTFTPLFGLSEVVLLFLPGGKQDTHGAISNV